MASIPVPRSYPAIVGEMVDAILARLGLPSLKVGSPVLSIVEAAAQSDLRSSQDIFNLLNSLSLDRAEGQALDRLGADEQVPRQAQTPATGRVDVGDGSFVKITTRIYQGGGAPIVGTVALAIEDAALFPASGSVYIGRGTTNYEGPLAYSAKTNLGSFWTLTLSGGTTKFHNLGETVVLAQGGNRNIAAGTLMRTPQGNAGAAVQFATSFTAVIPDGETEVNDVPAVARVPGTIGNVGINSVTDFVSPPFGGAVVNNSEPFANGFDTEDDQRYRERIRDARQSRTKGTGLAITSGVVGLTAPDENNRILSASIVTREDEPVSLYVDDGTGYQEKTTGIAYEVIAEAAVGGEQYFQLAQGRPVAKAFLTSSLQAPFSLEPDSHLSVEVGGVRTTHLFADTDFRSLQNASAYEIVSSINSDPNLLWNARVSDGGTRVTVFAKMDTNEDIQVVDPDPGLTDINDFMGFPLDLAQTLWLYLDDRILNKDGRPAVLDTKPQTNWSAIASGDKLQLTVDGVPLYDGTGLGIAITDADFVNAGTQYVTVNANNNLASWAAVLNFKLSGVTAEVNGGGLTLTSNSGRSARAGLQVTGGAVGSAMFQDVVATGEGQDYTLDRNLGQIKLNEALQPGARLTAGSLATRSFLETPSFTAHAVVSEATSVSGQNGAELWVVVDGGAVLVLTAVGPGTVLTVTNPASPAWGKRVRYNSNTGANLFGNGAVGDWLIATDTAFNIANRGAFRIVAKAGDGSWVEIEQSSSWSATQTAFALSVGGLRVVRTPAIPQRLYVPVGTNYTALSLVAQLAPQIRGGTAVVYRTTRVRLRTNTFTGGDIAAVAGNTEGLALGFPLADAVPSGISHLANLTAGHPQDGTPSFFVYDVNTSSGVTNVDYGAGNVPSSGDLLVGLKTVADGGGERWGNDNFVSSLDNRAGVVLTLRQSVVKQWLPDQRFYFASPYGITARDQLGMTVDGDDVQKRYVMNMYRRIKPTTGTYGITNFFKDVDNGNQSLAQAFGTGFNWQDFAIAMKARQKANGILWRYYRHGAEGNRARVGYTYPGAALSAVTVSTDSRATAWADIRVQLGSGAARNVTAIRNTSKIAAIALNGPDGDSLYQFLYVFNLPVASGAREIRLNYTAGSGLRTGGVTGGTSGATATTVSDNGTYVVITGVTGTFINGEALTFGGGGTATASGTQYGYTTFTLTLPPTTPAVTDHGIADPNTVWLQSSDANFGTGPKTVAARTATTISYVDVATTTGSIAGTLTISLDPAGEVSLTGASAVAGDLFTIGSGTAVPAALVTTIKTATLGTDRVTGASPNVPAGTGTVLAWYVLNSAAALSLYPLNASANSTTNIINSVGAVAGTPITGFEYSAGTISWATYEAPANGLGANNGGLGPWYYLVDGLNFVRSTNTPVLPSNDFEFTFKDAVTAGLATGSDWANEDVRAVPITAANVVAYLDTAAVGGLFSVSEIVTARRSSEPQVTTVTAGSTGSVQSTGGTANTATAAVVGNAVTAGGTLVAAISTSESDGLTGATWLALENTVTSPKVIVTGSTALTSLTSGGVMTWSGTKAWKYSADVGDALTVGGSYQVERQGDFVAFICAATPDGFASVAEGDWVVVDPHIVDPAYAVTGTMSSLNRGVFRVVRTDNASTPKVFWVENSRAVEQTATVDVAFLDFDSVMPNDQLIINTPVWGIDNLGTWRIASIDTTNQFRFSLDVTTRTPVSTGPIAALGTNSSLVQIYEAEPSRLIKYLLGVAPNGDSTDIKFSTTAGSRLVNSTYGTIMAALDKLDFGIGSDGSAAPVTPGIDGYSHNTGLIEEANRTVYGDEAQSSSYPGIAAAGANININGPLVRRIQISLALRVKTGISTIDIADTVRSAVAAVINETGVGVPVAISELIAAAQSVNGVVAVTVLSPAFGTGSDIISVQPFEKPLVIDAEQDVQISFVGT